MARATGKAPVNVRFTLAQESIDAGLPHTITLALS